MKSFIARRLLLLAILLAVGLIQFDALYALSDGRSYNVQDYGARADSTHNSTVAVQAAIDACTADGGGAVYFPSGHYMVDEVILRDHVVLHFGPECSIQGMIHVSNITGAAIIGDPKSRVTTGAVRIAGSSKLRFEHLFSRVGWVMRDCRDVVIENVKIEQEMRRQANGLAITLVDCRDVYLSECELTCNDDAFCLKRSGENIHITNSLLCGRQAASFKIGTETDGPFRNISMTNCIIYNSNRAGINIEAVDGSDIDGVHISGIRMYNVAAPFFIRLGNRDRYAKGWGSIRNIEISDVHFVGGQHDEGIGSSITGLPGHPVEHVRFSDIHIITTGGGTVEQTWREVPQRERFYPEYDIFGVLPAFGFYCRYVEGISFTNVTLDFLEPELRPAIFCEEVKDLRIDALGAQYWIPRSQYTEPKEAGEVSIVLQQVQQAVVRNTAAPITAPLVDVRGTRSTDIALIDNDQRLSQVVPYAIAPEVDGWLTIEPLAEIEVTDLQVPEMIAGAPAEIAARISNTGDPGFYHVDLAIDGAFTDRKWGWIDRGGDKTVHLEVPPLYEDRDYDFTVGPITRTAGIRPVKPTLVVHNIDMPTIGAVNEELPVQGYIQNTGSDALEEPFELYHDERLLASRQVGLDPGESDTVEMPVSFPAPGHYTVTAGTLSRSVSVNPIWIDENADGAIDAGEPTFVQFGEALQTAESGDIIMVHPGHFYVDSSALPLVIDVPNLTLRSVAGYETTIIEAVDANEEAYEGHALFSVTADGVVIEGFTLKLGVYNVYVEKARDVEIRNNFFNTSRRYHIYMVDASDVTIEGNRSRVGRYSFLTTDNCSGCLIENNYHYEDPCGYMLVDSDRNTIRANHFDALSWYGVTLSNSDNNVVENNLFEGGRICGLQTRGTSIGNRIVRNTFFGNRTEAVLITGGSRDNEVNQNNITGNRGLAVTNETPYRLDAMKNWWGSARGPAGAGAGSGDTVDEQVDFTPWLKVPVNNSWPLEGTR